MTTIERLRSRIARRRLYRATLAELRAMPLDVALDLDLDRAEAPAIAWRAAYGA